MSQTWEAVTKSTKPPRHVKRIEILRVHKRFEFWDLKSRNCERATHVWEDNTKMNLKKLYCSNCETATHVWKDNTKMNLTKLYCDNKSNRAKNKNWWRIVWQFWWSLIFLNSVAGNYFLTNWESISFSQVTHHQEGRVVRTTYKVGLKYCRVNVCILEKSELTRMVCHYEKSWS
jgi:hypothetical protein